MDTDNLEKIKRLVIVSLFSDDTLMEMLVLKGGNALDIIHNISPRASLDFDFSIENEIEKDNLQTINTKIEKNLIDTFNSNNLKVFDQRFEERPRTISPKVADFWGGYMIEFKIIGNEKFTEHHADPASLRRNAIVIGPRQEKKIRIEISKFEYCKPKIARDLDGFTIYVYTPEMIAFEKLRAICQQMDEYKDIIDKPSLTARARDFFDINAIFEHFKIDLRKEGNYELIKNIFEAKRVPLSFIGHIHKYREFHRPDFSVVGDTLKPGQKLEDFDFYFDYVLNLVDELQTFWEI